MFHSARIKLTAWYLLIIMLISMFFSLAIYRVLSNELDRFARTQRLRIERRFEQGMYPPDMKSQFPSAPDPELIEEVKDHLKLILIIINGTILVVSGGIGYFLAGRTLKPIQVMVDEQNRFVADASHEFRTPLTALKSNIEVTLMDKKLNVHEAKKVLEDSLGDINQLQSLSDTLLRSAQYQSADANHHMDHVSITEVVNEALKKATLLARQKEITLKTDIEENIIEGDSKSLSELLIILLDNAIKYSPPKTTVSIISKKQDSKIQMQVTDQGQGIDEKDQPHIFDRFYRADKSRTKNETSGYGLGLSIAKKIVKSHHGTIDVKSELKKGTTFTMLFPIKQS